MSSNNIPTVKPIQTKEYEQNKAGMMLYLNCPFVQLCLVHLEVVNPFCYRI